LPAALAGSPESQRTLGLLTEGPQFTFYLDGVKIAEFEESELVSGDIAMWASAGERASRLLWDNLEIYELK
jgi:hypothetical protein